MGIYVFDFSIPPSTTSVKQNLEVEGEVLSKLYILIPSGHNALAGMRIMYGEQQLLPSVHDTYFKGNDVVYNFEPLLPLPSSPCVLTYEGYNLDSNNQHTFYTVIETRSEEEAKPLDVLRDFVDILKRVMRIR